MNSAMISGAGLVTLLAYAGPFAALAFLPRWRLLAFYTVIVLVLSVAATMSLTPAMGALSALGLVAILVAGAIGGLIACALRLSFRSSPPSTVRNAIVLAVGFFALPLLGFGLSALQRSHTSRYGPPPSPPAMPR